MSQSLIAIDASPNTKTDDVSFALKRIINPWTWQKGEGIQKLERYFKDNYQAKFALAVQSGRLALNFLLKALLNEGDEALTQAFTCLVVPNAISQALGKPVFVDVDKNTYNLDPKDLVKKITKRTKVVIVQHTFGIPAPLEEIKAICDQNNLILIEDCAHALGAKYKNTLVGKFGDAAIFSFNQDKIISSVSGGLLITKNNKIINNLNSQFSKLKTPSNMEIFKLLLHPLLWQLAIPLYEKASIGKGVVFAGWKLGILGNTVSKDEENGKLPSSKMKSFSNVQAEIALKMLSRLKEDNQKRSAISKKYKEELSDLPIIHPKPPKNAGSIYLRYPIQVKDPAKLLKIARSQNIILGRWYNKPVFPWTEASKRYYSYSSCKNAEEIGEKIINLPTYPRLTEEEVERVISVVKFYASS